MSGILDAGSAEELIADVWTGGVCATTGGSQCLHEAHRMLMSDDAAVPAAYSCRHVYGS